MQVSSSMSTPGPSEVNPIKSTGRHRLQAVASSGDLSLPRPLALGGKERALKQLVMPGIMTGKSGFVSRPYQPSGGIPSPVSVASLTLTVADPRQPTAALVLTLPPLVSQLPSVAWLWPPQIAIMIL